MWRRWMRFSTASMWGNGILGAYYLMTRTPAGIDAFDPENLLMFLSGAVNGHAGPGLARFTVCGKSPVTGGIGEARSEGPFAVALKKERLRWHRDERQAGCPRRAGD